MKLQFPDGARGFYLGLNGHNVFGGKFMIDKGVVA